MKIWVCKVPKVRYIVFINAWVAELADALDLGSSAERRAGSTPASRTRPNVCSAAHRACCRIFSDSFRGSKATRGTGFAAGRRAVAAAAAEAAS